MADPISAGQSNFPSLSFCCFETENKEQILKVTALGCAILGSATLITCVAIGSATLTAPLLISSTVLLIISGIAATILSCSEKSVAPSVDTGSRGYLTQVMQVTLRDLKAGFYTSPDGTQHDLQTATKYAANHTKVFLNAGAVYQRTGTHPAGVIVKNQDCLYAAKDLCDMGRHPIVLDMASNGHFGGGYLMGARAQEEDLCRRSGLSLALDPIHGLQKNNYYPLSDQSPSAGLYVPRVPVFRAGKDANYQYLNQPFEVAFGVFAAKNRPTLDWSSGKPRLNDEDAAILREKIRAFFALALQQGHDSVVFGALGCGAFCNPPEHVAEITMDVIDKEFAHCFRAIVIAVEDDHNTHREHNPDGNFKPFANQASAHGGVVIETEILGAV